MKKILLILILVNINFLIIGGITRLKEIKNCAKANVIIQRYTDGKPEGSAVTVEKSRSMRFCSTGLFDITTPWIWHDNIKTPSKNYILVKVEIS